jgi:hypothetical protein
MPDVLNEITHVTQCATATSTAAPVPLFSAASLPKLMPDIPIEMLRQIFAYLFSPLRVHRAHEFPWYLRLGKVCSRALLWSTFWKKIEIDWEHNFLRLIRFSERLKAILAFFLNRTQGAPFSFSFSHVQSLASLALLISLWTIISS